MRWIRYWIEYGFLKFMLGLFDLMSAAHAEAVLTRLSGLYYALAVSRRRIAIDNILKAGIASDYKEANRIARRSFRHFALVVLESLKSGEIMADGIEHHIRVSVSPELDRILKDTKQGLIMASGHFGSWEIAAQLVSNVKPVAGVTKKMSNPMVNVLMEQRKPRNNFHLLPKYDRENASRFLNVLKTGEVLALMIDQHASWRGILVDFFGRPASTHTAIALLHLVTKAPICFGYCWRVSPGQYELRAEGPLYFKPTGDKNADIRTILETLNRHLEKAVREHPEQYLWGHRRWKEEEFVRSDMRDQLPAAAK